MNRKELRKRAAVGLGQVLHSIANRKIREREEIERELEKVNSVVYEIYTYVPESDVNLEGDVKICMDAVKYVRGEHSSLKFLYAKAIDELVEDEEEQKRYKGDFSIVDKVFDEAIEKVGETVLEVVDYFDENGVTPNFEITGRGLLNDLRMRERCRVKTGQRRYINTNEDLKRVLRETHKNLEKEIRESSDPEIVARSKKLKGWYEVVLDVLVD